VETVYNAETVWVNTHSTRKRSQLEKSIKTDTVVYN